MFHATLNTLNGSPLQMGPLQNGVKHGGVKIGAGATGVKRGGVQKERRTPFKRALDAARRRPELGGIELPVTRVKDELLAQLEQHRVVIIIGETGSGKTTQIPQMLVRSSLCARGRVAVTQPRRVAAVSVATRVAKEMGVALGDEVGYCIRFEDKSSQSTRIKFMTDGMMLREATADPMLKKYDVVIIDEAHERSIATDVLLAVMKELAAKRSDLRLVVMSATLDVDLFTTYFPRSKALFLEGRPFPVQIMYTPKPEPDYQDAAVVAVMQIHLEEADGDILVFLTGQDEIESTLAVLQKRASLLPAKAQQLLVLPIFAALPSAQQMKVFEAAPPGVRKVVLATNIAETSITIPGVKYVVDTGMVKARTHMTNAAADALLVVPISKDAARQRCGRAGRVAAGKCFRLYTKDAFAQDLAEHTTPEIQRCNLASIILQLYLYGIDDVCQFDFIEPPSQERIEGALVELFCLGAVAEGQELTPRGRKMAVLPMNPPYAAALLSAEERGCVPEVLVVVALLSVDNIYHVPSDRREQADAARKTFVHPDGDTVTLLNLWRRWHTSTNRGAWCKSHFVNSRAMSRAADVRKQLGRLCNGQLKMKCDALRLAEAPDVEAVRRALCAGLFTKAASLEPSTGKYVTRQGRREVLIHPSSVLHMQKAEWVVFSELVFTTKLFMRQVTRIDHRWIEEAASNHGGSG